MKARMRDLEIFMNLESHDSPEWLGERVVPYRSAPVFAQDKVHLMQYSLIPAWSKERKLKFATFNCRLDGASNKPTWKKPFLNHHCVVPLNAFVEPVYTGDYAGNMMAFESNELLLAAGIFDTWTDRTTGEVIESFAVMTSDPCDFVKGVGHDRQPIFLSKESAKKWLELQAAAPETVEFLMTEALTPQLSVSVDRPMKAGWEKRR